MKRTSPPGSDRRLARGHRRRSVISTVDDDEEAPMPAGPDDALHPGGAPTPLAPTHLTLLPWPDTVIDQVGHDPRSEYVERFWLGVIGPSCCWFLRHLAVRFEAEPDGFDLDVAECARALGLGAGLGRNAPLGRTLT